MATIWLETLHAELYAENVGKNAATNKEDDLFADLTVCFRDMVVGPRLLFQRYVATNKPAACLLKTFKKYGGKVIVQLFHRNAAANKRLGQQFVGLFAEIM